MGELGGVVPLARGLAGWREMEILGDDEHGGWWMGFIRRPLISI
jgi:hypothetical protein